MSSIAAIAARRAFIRQPIRKVAQQPMRRYASKTKMEEAGLERGARKDPELYVLYAIMAGGLGLVGWYLGRKPTSTTSQSNVRIGQSSMPWEIEDKDADKESFSKYQYHPHGDKPKPLKDAPSALNEVIIPNVTLPKDLHERYNKYGKDY